MKVWLSPLEITKIRKLPANDQKRALEIIETNQENSYMNDLNLRRERETSKERIIYPVEKDYPSIIDLKCQKHQITVTLSNERIISIPTA